MKKLVFSYYDTVSRDKVPCLKGVTVMTKMIIYKVFYVHKTEGPLRGEFLGALAERRKNFRGRSRMHSGLRWARLAFGHQVEDRNSIYILTEELNFKNDAILPAGKKIFSKEEYLWMIEEVDLGTKWEGGLNKATLRFVN